MTYDLRRKLWIFGAGLLIGYGVTAMFSDTYPPDADAYPLTSVSSQYPTPTFDRELKEHRAVIGCMDGIFVVGGITFWGMSEVIAPKQPYAIVADDEGDKSASPAFVHTWRCNAYNRFTQD